jgi:hypothetical protein
MRYVYVQWEDKSFSTSKLYSYTYFYYEPEVLADFWSRY